MEQAYPLQWPEGRNRTKAVSREEGRFKGTAIGIRDALLAEVARMGGRNPILSTNMPLRRDGLPYANAKEPEDPGVALYFEREGNRVCFACDQYDRVWKNMRAIAKTIEAMRGIERWGSKEMLDRAFTGFAALPPPDAPIEMPGPNALPQPWFDVLGVDENASWSVIRSAYREKMREASDAEKLPINQAYDQAKRQRL